MSEIMMFVGLDVSLNHMGVCSVDHEGQLHDWAFLTNTKKFVKEDPDHGQYFTLPSARNDHPNHFRRIDVFCNFLDKHLNRWASSQNADQICSIEGYAINSKNTRLYETAELIGLLKWTCCKSGRKVRVHDPLTVKLFASHYGHADKDQLYCQFMDETGVSVPTTWLKEGKKKILSGPGTDVADSYFIARMCWMEHQLRIGQMMLGDLPTHLKGIFTRATKTYPECIIHRPYLSFGDENA